MKKILLATTNAQKIAEYQNLWNLHHQSMTLISLQDLNAEDDEAPETKPTFSGNALQKAEYYWKKYHIPVICDDSGLEVLHLNLFPGVNSKRWLEEKGFIFKINELLKMLNHQDSSCQYVCAIAYYDDVHQEVFTGTCAGKLVKPRGTNGFGFDVGFYVPEYDKTFNQINLNLKNQISHRAQAFAKLQTWLADNQKI